MIRVVAVVKYIFGFATSCWCVSAPEPGVALWQSVAMKCGNSDVVRVTGIPFKTMAFFVNDIPRKYTGSTQVHKGAVHLSLPIKRAISNTVT